MASNTYNTIMLKGNLAEKFFEAQSMEAILPGHMVQKHTDGKLKKHATAAGPGPNTFAIENQTPWENFTGKAIDRAWASGDRVQYWAPAPGSVVNALVAANAVAIAQGAAVESAGDGTVRLRTGTNTIVGWAEEAVDNSASAAVARIAILVA